MDRCPCECNSGGFCGGCGHAGCGRRRDDAEYRRGVEDTKRAQQAGPAGSEAREAAYREMEEQWAREGFDG